MSQTWWFEWLSLIASVATIIALVIAVLSVWGVWRARPRFTFNNAASSKDTMMINIANIGEERAGNLVGLFEILDSHGRGLKGGDWVTLAEFPKGPMTVVFYDPNSAFFQGDMDLVKFPLQDQQGFRIILLWQAPVRRWQTRNVTATMTVAARYSDQKLEITKDRRWTGRRRSSS